MEMSLSDTAPIWPTREQLDAYAKRSGNLEDRQYFSVRDAGIFARRYVADSRPPIT
jgi:hypothetical protein